MIGAWEERVERLRGLTKRGVMLSFSIWAPSDLDVPPVSRALVWLSATDETFAGKTIDEALAAAEQAVAVTKR